MSVSDPSRIVIDESIVMLQIVVSLTNDSRGVKYDCNITIVQGQRAYCYKSFYSHYLLMFAISKSACPWQASAQSNVYE